MGEIQDTADFFGDSLELSQKATETDTDVIVFCGVHFMAETASILCPDKIVLLPDRHAGCPMADMLTAKSLYRLKRDYPKAAVVCYINSSAAVKAASDIGCTSANAVPIVAKLASAEEIIFVPDQYLGNYAAAQSGREMILWPGFCPTHLRIQPQDIARQKAEHPQAHLCVPSGERTSPGSQIALLLRENSRQFNSFVVGEDDEGTSWSEPRELPAALTGDRHTARYAPDGRLFITFRDMAHDSPTRGDWVGWVGTYHDITQRMDLV